MLLSPAEQKLLHRIMDLFTELDIEPETGERALLWAAGASLGLRQAPLVSDSVLSVLADGWASAVSDENSAPLRD